MNNFCKLLILFGLLSFNCVSTLAQDSESNDEGSSFGVYYALPVGSFKSTDVHDGGFAKPGIGVVFDSRSKPKFLPQNMGLYFHSTYQWNNMDNDKLQEAFTKELGNRTVTSQSKYSPILTTIGPSYLLALGKNTKLAINTGVGIMFNSTRSFSVTVYDANNNEIVKENVNFDNNPSFAYVVGAELRFKLIEGVMGGAIYIDYTSSTQGTTLTFTTASPTSSFEKLEYLNIGFKLTFPKTVTKIK